MDAASRAATAAAREVQGTRAGSGREATTDATLVERLRAGDETAFIRLLELHGATLRRIARIYATDAVADEIVQETWIAVLRGIDGFEGRASLRTWLVRILVNIARTHGAREHRQVPFSAFVGPDDEGAEAAVEPDRFQGPDGRFPGGWVSFPERWDEQPEVRFLSTEGVLVAHRAIDALPPAQREVVTLRDIEGWTSDEVAQAMAISPGNQRVLLHRGRSRVRAALETAVSERRASEGSGR